MEDQFLKAALKAKCVSSHKMEPSVFTLTVRFQATDNTTGATLTASHAYFNAYQCPQLSILFTSFYTPQTAISFRYIVSADDERLTCRDLKLALRYTKIIYLQWFAVVIHPKGVRWGWGQGSVQANQVLAHQTWKKHFIMELILCTGALSFENKRQICCNKLEEHCCLKYCVL